MGRGTESGESNLKLFLMKITGLKEGDKTRIEQTEVRGKDDLLKLEETTQKVWGDLIDIKIRTYEPRKGETARELRLYLKDKEEGELCIVSCGLNSIGRSIINTLLSLENPNGHLHISVYNKKSNELPGVSITFNGQKEGWKYSVAELKPYITENTYKRRGQPVIEKEYFELDNFLIAELEKNVIPKLNRRKNDSGIKVRTENKISLIPEQHPAENSTDDLPF
jgi:hypothetical protein